MQRNASAVHHLPHSLCRGTHACAPARDGATPCAMRWLRPQLSIIDAVCASQPARPATPSFPFFTCQNTYSSPPISQTPSNLQWGAPLSAPSLPSQGKQGALAGAYWPLPPASHCAPPPACLSACRTQLTAGQRGGQRPRRRALAPAWSWPCVHSGAR